MKRKVSLFLFFITFFVSAADIEVYFNHPVNAPAIETNLEDKIVTLIKSARKSLDIAVYDLDLPEIAKAMVFAKNKNNVEVRFITDEDNTGAENIEALKILNQGNVPWIDDTEDGSAGSGLQHNKFIVVDGKTVLTGSTNFTQSGIHGDKNEDGKVFNSGNDNHIVIIKSGSLADVFTKQFLQMWGDGPGGENDSLFGLKKESHKMETVYTDNDNIRIDVQFSPQSKRNYEGSTLFNMEKLISKANDCIYIGQFAFSAQNIADSIKLRHNAGVEVLGLGDSSFFYRSTSEFMDMLGKKVTDHRGKYEKKDSYTGKPNNPWYKKPADVRVANMEEEDKWHHKYLIVDNSVLTGSHNISGQGAFANDENIVIIYDKAIANQFKGHFLRRFKESSVKRRAPVYNAGTWEGIYFSAKEVAETLELVNTATFEQLDHDATLNSRAARNIINARKITSMKQLAAIPYVGAAAMRKLKNYISN